MNRDIPYLLNKYSTKQPGEIWPQEWVTNNTRDYRFKERIFLFDKLNNNRFLKGDQKTRAKYLIEHFNFNSLGSYSEEEIIIMIILYVKLEYTNYSISIYDYYLDKHNITEQMFINFLVKLHKQSLNSKYLESVM